jgi:hypothetical protein
MHITQNSLNMQLQAVANPHCFPHNFRTKIEQNASLQGITLQTGFFSALQ